MSRASRFVSFVGVVLLFLFASTRSARAQSANATPLVVLQIASDDADEQAAALTGALRSRVRSSQEWALAETSSSLSMMLAAFRCPRSPNETCLQKIAEHIKSDHFLWGTMTKSPGSQVTAELHFYARGKTDRSARATYSDNLRDQNDETLRKLAAQLFDRATGVVTMGSIAIHAGESDGIVLIDGQKRGQLDHGRATIETLVGDHTVIIRPNSTPQISRTVHVSPGQTERVEVAFSADGTAEISGNDKPISGRRVIGWTGVGVGVIAVAIGAIETAKWFSDKSDANSKLVNYHGNGCLNPVGDIMAAQNACNDNKDAKTASAIAWTLGAVGVASAVTGIYLLATEPHDSVPSDAHPPQARVRFAPSFGPGTAGLTAFGNF